MKLLLVEDNRQLADQLADALTDQNYVVDVARDGEEGWDLMTYGHYDLVMLDVTLPKMDGVSLCRKIRAKGYQTPVLMLTARSSSTDKVTGLDAGADDYLAKPVALNELNARLRALLRRNHKELTPVLEQGLLKLDPSSCQVTYDGKPVKLSPKEYLLLELFLRNGQRIYSRKAILDQLWGLDAELPGEDTVKAHIKGLRQRLRAVGVDNLIESVYGLGYRLNSEYVDANSAGPAGKVTDTPSLIIVTSEGTRAEKLQNAMHEWRSTPMGLIPAADLATHLHAIQPQLLLLDLTNDNESSLALCQTARQHKAWAWLPIIALVRRDDANIIRQAYEAGCDDVLEQPIPVGDLQSRVRNRLERVNTMRQCFTHKPVSAVT
ncbi:response regulator [filamentous cyanobacterium LEGE 11480]|uniref:Response regulator n=1 Tax=Romeriopsis navalis LEGE 11480 TaxID=2777977 RepID=A0A928VQH4_9CYAN|nr:response regulator [Romeriopsis navalis]MBE9030249.1 response regulator [Romeriopsis navalis LEGE 11480]